MMIRLSPLFGILAFWEIGVPLFKVPHYLMPLLTNVLAMD